MSKKKTGQTRIEGEDDFGLSTNPETDPADSDVTEVQEAVKDEVAMKESKPTGYDPYYDDPVPKGVGGSFVLRDGQRYRRRPE